MEFSLTEEQRLIQDTAADFLAACSSSEQVRSAMSSEAGYDPALWQRIHKEMGWPAVHIPEESGGLGLGCAELALILEQMGRFLLCSPFFATVCLGVNALLATGDARARERWLPDIAQGGQTATLAWAGAGGGCEPESVTAEVQRQGGDYRLDGTLRYVLDGHTATLLIVAARAPGSAGPAGISLFALPAATPGVQCRPLPTMDQTRRQAEVVLQDVRLPADHLLGEEGGGAAVLDKTLQLAAVAAAAEQTGGAGQCLDMSVAYAGERVQFGRPIAGFQAVKHKCADMLLLVESARSAAYYAACVAEEALRGGPLAEALPEAAAIAKTYCSEAFFHCAADSIQLHGGVGFTWEYDVHLYFKRARAMEGLLGSGAWHRERLAEQILGRAEP